MNSLDHEITLRKLRAEYWMTMAVTGIGKRRKIYHGTQGPEYTDEEKLQDCMDIADNHINQMDRLINMKMEMGG